MLRFLSNLLKWTQVLVVLYEAFKLGDVRVVSVTLGTRIPIVR